MKKILIGSLVGAIILFLSGFLSWVILPLHLHTFAYTPAQDSIMKVFSDNNFETGVYGLPMADNRNVSGFDSKYMEESEKMMKEGEGKPFASVYYNKEGMTMGVGVLLRGFFFDFITLLAACILLVAGFASMNSFFGRWWLVLVVGLLVSCYGPLMNFNWMGAPWHFTVDIIMQCFIDWALVGLWLAYYFGRK